MGKLSVLRAPFQKGTLAGWTALSQHETMQQVCWTFAALPKAVRPIIGCEGSSFQSSLERGW